jgi:hypothetical protein
MVFHPEIIALYVASFLMSFMISYSAYYGIQILRRWDIKSGSELQLILERKTYLISTILTYLFGFQLLSLFLYIFTADHLHTLFIGAMCAAGTLKVNEYGYPALILKMLIFLAAGLWLVLNYADNRGYDYPLIKKKYLLLIIITPLILMEMVFQAGYFLGLRPNIITSCCGSLFSTGETGYASEIASLPSTPMIVLFYFSAGATLSSGVYFYRSARGGYLFSILSGLTFLISLASIISFISLYFYELPTHHCPFCLLQREYGYIGYPLYTALFGSAVSGMGAGVLMPFRKIKSLEEIIPPTQKKLTLISLVLLAFFLLIVTYRIIFSDFRL